MNRRFDSDFLRKLVLFIHYSGLVGIEATLSIYSASVNPPDAPYSQLLSGNTLFDTVYATFNTSGVLAIGGILLAAGAIFALRSAPDPEEIKYEFENIREKIKSKPLPFLSGKGKKKKNENDQTSYGVPVAPSVPVYVPSDLPTYNPSTAKPVTFSFDVTDTYTNKRHVQEDDYTSNLIGPTLGLGATPGPPYSKSNKKKIFVNVDYPFSSSGRQPTTSQVIEPIYNEVSQTLTNALSGQFDYSDRISQRRKDVVSVNNDVTNDLQDDYNNDDEGDDEYEDENESESDPRYYPTMPPIYPSVKRKPEGRSLKNSRIGSGRQMRMEDEGRSPNGGRRASWPSNKSYYPVRHPKWRHHQTRSKMKTHQSSSPKKKNKNQSSSSSSTFNFFDTSRYF